MTSSFELSVRHECRFGNPQRRTVCPRLLNWYWFVDAADLFLSTLVVGEIRKGIELTRRSDPEKAARFEDWLRKIQTAFGARILGIDNSVSDRWGRRFQWSPNKLRDTMAQICAGSE